MKMGTLRANRYGSIKEIIGKRGYLEIEHKSEHRAWMRHGVQLFIASYVMLSYTWILLGCDLTQSQGKDVSRAGATCF